MKILKLCILIFSLHCVSAQQTSKITDVIVYLDGAEVTRTAKVNVDSGTKIIKLNALSPNIDESSIQVSGLKNTSILSINYGINFLSKQKENDSIILLKNKIESLNDDIQYETNIISGYQEELYLIKNNKTLWNEREVVQLEKLKNFAKYYRTRITELNLAIHKANKTIKIYRTKQSDITKQLQEFNIDEKVQTGEIILKLNSDITTSLDLKVTYNVSNAGWFPIYDLKADKINAPLNLEYKAHVYQNSGCDWDDVNLVLSTSDPNTNNVKPILYPKFLNFTNRYTANRNQRATKSYTYKYNPLVKHVSGVITSSDGLPLPGVTVIEKGTNNGAVTDFDGKYKLKTTNGNALEYSYIGMQTETLPIHSSVMNVNLNEDSSALEEVIVVGYSAKKSNVSQALRGEVAGVNILSRDGVPGSSAEVKIRGFGAINGNSKPLYIVDGTPIDEDDFRALNPEDIAFIDVLKDSGATSIYGNRARNGVVVITTKDEANENGLGVTKETGITNTRFEIKKTYSIPSDGDIAVIKIDEFSVPATYQHFTAPIINENVFLTAKIGNWEQYNLLPAEANVYFEGSYSGKTNINPAVTTDSLTVSLGVDPNIVAKRTQLKNFKKNALIGSNKVIYKGFDIAIKNNKTAAIKLTVLDRIPISENKTIKIEDIETGTANYDKKKGILKWKLNIAPNQKKTLNLSYTLKYPKEKRINL